MHTVTKSHPRVKPARSIRLDQRPQEELPGLLHITCGQAENHYYLRPLASDFGLAFDLEKFATEGGDTYHVLLSLADGKHSCECKGFLRWSRCKHVAGLLALRQAGKL